jgi:hypothetical protein
MEQNTLTWEKLTLPFSNELRNVLNQQHLAVQFIGMTGRHLLPEKEDKSNINMEFLPREKMFAGNKIRQGFKIVFHPETHSLQIRRKELKIVKEINLEGKTFKNAFVELKNVLVELDVDVSSLKMEQPYELPHDSLKEGKYFFRDKTEFIEENIRYRHNAELLLREIVAEFNNTDPVRIWPHHFDTGTIIHLEKNQSGETTKSIGLGLAIPDDMVPEPYFYLSFWSENSTSSLEIPQNLPAGKWMMPEWDGAVISISEIIQVGSAEKQYDLVKAFFEAVIKKSVALLAMD